ncbi:MAG: polyprenyl synthetase family protein [Gammaproteobacteria bacterium]|nr:polyprenyl synthetase family protein [Gammaproteobacteria bacterium]
MTTESDNNGVTINNNGGTTTPHGLHVGEESVSGQLKRVEGRLLEALECEVDVVRELGRHVLGAGGKRIRPGMVLLACGLADVRDDVRFDIAAAFELIHTATLIHDDIVDNSSQRRKRLSANALWSNATAVLSGDFLYSRAFELLTGTGNIKLLSYVSRMTNQLAQGELMQLGNMKNPQLCKERYYNVIHHKTACLFEACMLSASFLTDLPTPFIRALGGFGLCFGEAFQVRDDYLDYLGNVDVIGKAPGGDLRDGKPTLPYIHALAGCNHEAERDLLVRAIAEPDASGSNFDDVTAIIQAHGGFTHTREVLEQRLHQISVHVDVLRVTTASTDFVGEVDALIRKLSLPEGTS